MSAKITAAIKAARAYPMDQILFNGPLQRELEALADLVAVCGRASRLCRKLHRLRIHRVAAEDVIKGLPRASAMALNWQFLAQLRHVAAEKCLSGMRSGGRDRAAESTRN